MKRIWFRRIAWRSGTAPAANRRRLIEDVPGSRVGGGGAGRRRGIRSEIARSSPRIHVVQPRVFPGGDIGRLAVCGTVNDLAMMGATEPLGVTCGIVIEEGFDIEELQRLCASMRAACREADTAIVSGDTKVMRRGEVDGLIVNTTGVGFADRAVVTGALRPGDVLIATGTMGDHGIAVMAARHQIELGGSLRSDVAPLNGLSREVLAAGGDAVVALKDPTRGGLASALHEMAEASAVGVLINEAAVPGRGEVRASAECRLDPLAIASEARRSSGFGRSAPAWFWRRFSRTSSAPTPRSSAAASTTFSGRSCSGPGSAACF